METDKISLALCEVFFLLSSTAFCDDFLFIYKNHKKLVGNKSKTGLDD